jgi:hypothetical protein
MPKYMVKIAKNNVFRKWKSQNTKQEESNKSSTDDEEEIGPIFRGYTYEHRITTKTENVRITRSYSKREESNNVVTKQSTSGSSSPSGSETSFHAEYETDDDHDDHDDQLKGKEVRKKKR